MVEGEAGTWTLRPALLMLRRRGSMRKAGRGSVLMAYEGEHKKLEFVEVEKKHEYVEGCKKGGDVVNRCGSCLSRFI